MDELSVYKRVSAKGRFRDFQPNVLVLRAEILLFWDRTAPMMLFPDAAVSSKEKA